MSPVRYFFGLNVDWSKECQDDDTRFLRWGRVGGLGGGKKIDAKIASSRRFSPMKVKGVWSGEKIIRHAISAWGRGGYKKIDMKIASSRRHFP